MNCHFFQVDAFTTSVFSGNSACVVLLEDWIDDITLLNIARVNAVAETAFIFRQDDHFRLRWFTPDIEIDLCGHATLAAGHVVLSHLEPETKAATFDTISGKLQVTRYDSMYCMDLPSRPPAIAELPPSIAESLSQPPMEVLKGRDYILVYREESVVANLQINREQFDRINLDPGGVAATAPGNDCDFVSRFFTPQATILEDPVTGSAHCSLAPFWGRRLDKNELDAKQISTRGGELHCKVQGNRVHLFGHAITYAEGRIHF